MSRREDDDTRIPRLQNQSKRYTAEIDGRRPQVSLISELEARGAKVVCIYSGGLDFSGPVKEYFYRSGAVAVDSVINLTGFALVGGPASQDHPKAIDTLKSLGVPYLCAVPLVFQSFQEWEASELGLHPVQVALQVSLPELDGAIEPIIYAGREGATGKSVPLDDRISTLARRALKWGSLRRKENAEKKLAITIFSFPPDKGNVGTAAYPRRRRSLFLRNRRLYGTSTSRPRRRRDPLVPRPNASTSAGTSTSSARSSRSPRSSSSAATTSATRTRTR